MAGKYKLDDQIGYLLRLASQRHAAIFQKAVSNNLTPVQFSSLLRIAEQGEVSQNQLGRLSSIDVSTTKGLVIRLLDKKLIRRRSDPVDKRRFLITLSDEGQSLIAELQLVGQKISSETLSALSQSERKTLVELLRKIS